MALEFRKEKSTGKLCLKRVKQQIQETENMVTHKEDTDTSVEMKSVRQKEIKENG